MSISSESRCLVVGATNPTSIGYQAALTLLQAGVHHVTIMGRDQDKLNEALSLLSNKGLTGKVSGVLGDLKHPETMKAVVEEACRQMDEKLDCLLCCGGNGYSEYLGLDANDLESYRLMQNVAVLSPMMLAEAAFPQLSQSSNHMGGTIVFVGSVSGTSFAGYKLRAFGIRIFESLNLPHTFVYQRMFHGPTQRHTTSPWQERTR